MKMKKFLAVVLAFVFVFATAIPMNAAPTVTLEEIESVLREVAAERYEETGFDFLALMEEAGISAGDFAEFVFILYEVGDFDWEIRRYGDMWLVYIFEGLIEDFGWAIDYEYVEYVLLELQLIRVVTAMLTTLGIDVAEDLLDGIFTVEMMFFDIMDFDELVVRLVENPYVDEILERIAAHPDDVLEDMFSFDWVDAIEAFLDGGDVPAGFLYIDELLGGIFGEHADELEEIIYQQYAQVQMHRIFDEWWEFERMMLPAFESGWIYSGQLEERFSNPVTEPTEWFFEIFDFDYFLNMSFVNRGDNDVTVVYFLYDGWDYVRTRTIELAPGQRVSRQIDLSELPSAWNVGEWNIFFLGEGEMNVGFSYRLTANDVPGRR